MQLNNPTVCLNMIVRNESKIITRLLKSVEAIVDTYCICDTGSTDNTVELIKTFFKERNIQGKIVYEKFKNFEYNRNFALKNALGMSDYILFIDADMEMVFKNFNKQILWQADAFLVLQGSKDFHYQNIRIIKNYGEKDADNELNEVKYIGVTHEYVNTGPYKIMSLPMEIIFMNDFGDGGSKSNKYERDVKLLEEDLLRDPLNARTLFYLANSHFDHGINDKALEYYQKRIDVGGWFQEIFYSYYRIGQIHYRMENYDKAIYSWLEAIQVHPERLETIFKIIYHYRITNKPRIAMTFYKTIEEYLKKYITKTTNNSSFLFLENDIYTYKLYYEYIVIAFYNDIKKVENEIVYILSDCKNKNIITSTFLTMKFYDWRLPTVKEIDISKSIVSSVNEKDYNFCSSSPSLIKNSEGNYLVNIRYVNYTLDDNYTKYNFDNYVLSINEFVKYDKDFNVLERNMIDNINHDGRLYGGVEDVRIFEHDDGLVFIGTGFHKNNKIGIVYGKYDPTKNELQPKEVTQKFKNTDCEKNWVYFKYNKFSALKIIYNWYPLTIGIIDNGILRQDIIKNTPDYFREIRGSTCGFNYNGELWFVTHLVSYESPRFYYNVIVVIDENFKYIKYSCPIKFTGSCIEYVLGIVVEDNRVIISYSETDSSSKIGIFNKDIVLSKIKYMANL